MVEFRVLRCVQCQTFQVLQVTKSPKWKCKLCGEKQSVLKEYGRGTGADCRRHVQRLNTLRMEINSTVEDTSLTSALDGHTSSASNSYHSEDGDQMQSFPEQKKTSHWETFLDKDAVDENEEEAQEANPKTKGGAYFGNHEVIEEGIRVTTDWSSYHNERKQAWRNKRKMHNESRSKWKKSAKYEDDNGDNDDSDDEYCLSSNISSERNSGSYSTNNRFKSSWKQNRFSTSTRNSLNQGFSDVNSQNRPEISSLSSKSLINCQASAADFTSTPNDRAGKSPCIQSYNGNNDKRYNFKQENFSKTNTESDSHTTFSVVTTSGTERNKSNLSSKSSAIPMSTSSKWTTFITDNDNEDDSDDNSDDSNAFQQIFTNDASNSTVKLSSSPGSDKHCHVPVLFDTWDTFVKEKNSHYIDDSNEDNDNDVNENHKESSCSIKIFQQNWNINNDITRDRAFSHFNKESKGTESSKTKNERNGGNDPQGGQRKIRSADIGSINNFLSQRNRLGGENKLSLFQIGDDYDEDHDAWDLDI